MSQGADDKADVGSTDKQQDKKTSADNAYKSSATHKNEKKSGFFSPMLITVLLAFAVIIAVTYYYMPDKFNQYLSFSSASESEASTDADVVVSAQSSSENQGFVPTAPAANYASNNHLQQANWAAQQRADFDKRRAEFAKRSADNRPQQWQSATPSEPPQWIKDRQAEMEKQRAQYMKDMAEQQAKWEESYKRNQMRMNPYQQQAVNNQPYYGQRPVMPNQPPQQNNPVNQPPQQYNPANQPPQQYNPANQPPPQYYYRPPAYNYAPYYAPYGWQGYGYR